MTTLLHRSFGALLCTASFTFAQQVVEEKQTTTTTNTLGTITELSPERIEVRTETSPDPIRYTFSKTTTYVDEKGQAVSVKTMKSGLPVTVYYTRDGDQMVATKVVIRTAGAAPGTTTTTNSLGTITEFGPDRFLIKSETSPDPVRYSYSKTTTYVDENGNPVSIKTVKSGLPVTVYYTKVGDSMVATKVVVRKIVSTPDVAPVPPIVETKKTTTTTEERKE